MISARRRSNWTGADYDSQEVLHLIGNRDAVARVSRARRGHPVRRIFRAVRSRLNLHCLSTQQHAAVDWDAARRAGEAVNRGDVAAADRIVQATADTRGTAFAAFRFIDVH